MNSSKKIVHLIITGLCLMLANPYVLSAITKKKQQCSGYCYWKEAFINFIDDNGTAIGFTQRTYYHLSGGKESWRPSGDQFDTHVESNAPFEVYASVNKKTDAEKPIKVQHNVMPEQKVVLVCNDGKKFTISSDIFIRLQSLNLMINDFGDSQDGQILEIPLHQKISSMAINIIIQCLNVTVPEASNLVSSEIKKTKAIYRWLISCCSHKGLDDYKDLLFAASFLDIKELKPALYLLLAAKLGACTDRDKPFAPYEYNGQLLEPSLEYYDETNRYNFLRQNFEENDIKSILIAYYMINDHQLCPNHFFVPKCTMQFMWLDLDMDRDLTDDELLTVAKEKKLLLPKYPNCPARQKKVSGYTDPRWE